MKVPREILKGYCILVCTEYFILMSILQGKSEEVAESVAPLVKSALAFAALSCEEGYSVENDRVLYHEHSAVRTGHYSLCFAWNCCLHACLTLCTPGKTVLSLVFPAK